MTKVMPVDNAGNPPSDSQLRDIEATKYIRRIKNQVKKIYAQTYWNWITDRGPEPSPKGDLSYMARQAVRMNLDKIYEGHP